MKEFMLKFDENGDGKIEMSEVNSHLFFTTKVDHSNGLKLWSETVLRLMEHQEEI